MKKTITDQEHIEIINKKIKTMDGYKPGMKVFFTKDKAGYTWEEKWNDEIKILVSKAEHEIKRDYDFYNNFTAHTP